MKRAKTIAIWALLLGLFIAIFQLSKSPPRGHVPYGEFLDFVEENRVSNVRIINNQIRFDLYEGPGLYTIGVADDQLIRKLSEHQIPIAHGEKRKLSRTVLTYGVPLVLVLALLIFFTKRMQSGSSAGLVSIGKSRARKATNDHRITFEDVGGLADAKELMGDIIDFLKVPERWKKAGVRLPRGMLLEGPPGCGKTLLARAVAGEAGVPFFQISASEFVELFVGVGAARVRDMFENAKKEAPCVVFIDELDAVGRRRGSGIGSAHDEREQTLNQLLVSMDGFDQGDLVAVIAATNRPDVLDKALLRPGRFDRRVQIDPPRVDERREMLQIHTRDKPLAKDLELETVLAQMNGMNGADIESVANEAALLAIRRLRGTERTDVEIERADFDAAIKAQKAKEKIFDRLDAVLIESASQLSQPTGRAVLRITFTGDTPEQVEGELVWADGAFIKLRKTEDDSPLIIPKVQVKRIETLEGTEKADDMVGDHWAGQVTELA